MSLSWTPIPKHQLLLFFFSWCYKHSLVQTIRKLHYGVMKNKKRKQEKTELGVWFGRQRGVCVSVWACVWVCVCLECVYVLGISRRSVTWRAKTKGVNWRLAELRERWSLMSWPFPRSHWPHVKHKPALPATNTSYIISLAYYLYNLGTCCKALQSSRIISVEIVGNLNVSRKL